MTSKLEPEEHYDQSYFNSQWKGSQIGSKINKTHFLPHLHNAKTVIDFGCGGGVLLSELNVDRAIGIEINESAHDMAETLGIEVHKVLDTVEPEIADAIISNHALEHVSDPLGTLRGLHSKLKSGGRIVIAVPSDKANTKFKENDRDFHLFSWSANNIGNLLTAAGFEVLDARHSSLRWPPKMQLIYDTFGEHAVFLAGRLFGLLPHKRTQVVAVALKR